MFDRGMIREGMTVHSADGEKLGKIQSCSDSTFIIEKGFFLPTDYVCRYDDVSSIEGDDVRLAVTKDEFRRREVGNDDDATTRRAAAGSDPGWAGSEFGGLGVDRADRAAAGPDPANQLDPGLHGSGGWSTERAGDFRREGEEIRVPVVEEELEAVKRERDAGEVRLKKEVVTEHRQIDVPVTREQVRVERVPASGRAEASSDAFTERTETMPVREEEVEIRKRPVVKEEVRLRKERFVEQRAADAEVRREEVKVEGDESLRRDERSDRLPDDRGIGRRDPDDGI